MLSSINKAKKLIRTAIKNSLRHDTSPDRRNEALQPKHKLINSSQNHEKKNNHLMESQQQLVKQKDTMNKKENPNINEFKNHVSRFENKNINCVNDNVSTNNRCNFKMVDDPIGNTPPVIITITSNMTPLHRHVEKQEIKECDINMNTLMLRSNDFIETSFNESSYTKSSDDIIRDWIRFKRGDDKDETSTEKDFSIPKFLYVTGVRISNKELVPEMLMNLSEQNLASRKKSHKIRNKFNYENSLSKGDTTTRLLKQKSDTSMPINIKKQSPTSLLSLITSRQFSSKSDTFHKVPIYEEIYSRNTFKRQLTSYYTNSTTNTCENRNASKKSRESSTEFLRTDDSDQSNVLNTLPIESIVRQNDIILERNNFKKNTKHSETVNIRADHLFDAVYYTVNDYNIDPTLKKHIVKVISKNDKNSYTYTDTPILENNDVHNDSELMGGVSISIGLNDVDDKHSIEMCEIDKLQVANRENELRECSSSLLHMGFLNEVSSSAKDLVNLKYQNYSVKDNDISDGRNNYNQETKHEEKDIKKGEEIDLKLKSESKENHQSNKEIDKIQLESCDCKDNNLCDKILNTFPVSHDIVHTSVKNYKTNNSKHKTNNHTVKETNSMSDQDILNVCDTTMQETKQSLRERYVPGFAYNKHKMVEELDQNGTKHNRRNNASTKLYQNDIKPKCRDTLTSSNIETKEHDSKTPDLINELQSTNLFKQSVLKWDEQTLLEYKNKINEYNKIKKEEQIMTTGLKESPGKTKLFERQTVGQIIHEEPLEEDQPPKLQNVPSLKISHAPMTEESKKTKYDKSWLLKHGDKDRNTNAETSLLSSDLTFLRNFVYDLEKSVREKLQQNNRQCHKNSIKNKGKLKCLKDVDYNKVKSNIVNVCQSNSIAQKKAKRQKLNLHNDQRKLTHDEQSNTNIDKNSQSTTDILQKWLKSNVSNVLIKGETFLQDKKHVRPFREEMFWRKNEKKNKKLTAKKHEYRCTNTKHNNSLEKSNINKDKEANTTAKIHEYRCMNTKHNNNLEKSNVNKDKEANTTVNPKEVSSFATFDVPQKKETRIDSRTRNNNYFKRRAFNSLEQPKNRYREFKTVESQESEINSNNTAGGYNLSHVPRNSLSQLSPLHHYQTNQLRTSYSSTGYMSGESKRLEKIPYKDHYNVRAEDLDVAKRTIYTNKYTEDKFKFPKTNSKQVNKKLDNSHRHERNLPLKRTFNTCNINRQQSTKINDKHNVYDDTDRVIETQLKRNVMKNITTVNPFPKDMRLGYTQYVKQFYTNQCRRKT